MGILFEKFVSLLVKLRQNVALRVVQRTLIILFPIILLGSWAKVLASFLSVKGFIGSVFYVEKWLPHYQGLRNIFENLSKFTLGIVAVLAAYQAAKWMAKIYQRDGQLAGIVGMLSFLLLFYRENKGQWLLNWRVLGFSNLLLGLLIGLGVGYLFKKLTPCITPRQDEHTEILLTRAIRAFIPTTLVLGVSVVLNYFVSSFIYTQIVDKIGSFWQTIGVASQNLWKTLLTAAMTQICAFIGFSGPYAHDLADSSLAAANLKAALANQSLPYKYSATTLYQAYGTLGGVGCSLGLVLALLVVAKNKNYRRVAQLSFVPVFFNSNAALLTGIPVLFNPLYFLGFLVIPLLNMILAALFLSLNWLSFSVYPIPSGTPGPLIAFIGSGGDWRNLVFSLSLVLLDFLCYIPLILLAQKVMKRVSPLLLRGELND